jgi:hypothetical protein
VLEFGRRRSASHRWRVRVLLGCVVLATVLLTVVRAVDREPPPASHQSSAGIDVAARPPAVRVILVGHRLLGVRAGWELFARGPADLFRIQLAQGRITWTYIPPLEDLGPSVAFLVERNETVIQPADIAPGYVVPDGGQARLLTGPLSVGGPLVPGPAGTETVWATTGPPKLPRLSLVTLSGHRVGPSITVPPGAAQVLSTAVTDGRGNVLLSTEDYADYDAGPGWDHAEPGTIIAVGPATWLTEVCESGYERCHYQVINATNGHRRALPAAATQSPYYFTWPPAGVIAPDGSTAAVAEGGNGGATTVHLINLRTGATRNLGFRAAESGISAQETMAWSPNGRWLFVVTSGGKIVAIDPRTGRGQYLGIGLPSVSQVAVRT